ncbi:hypothetical protein [Aneurinibacillus terranovensis]|uniref:hypothetical protein n=1 Tax=Aneurinibacillus terranovensis TaxID=278991 RepID=UPI0003FF5BF9|nr:hypothetical protein [Aneurinibacillus terranovensis]
MNLNNFFKKSTDTELKLVDKQFEVNEKLVHEMFSNCADVKIQKNEFKNKENSTSVLMIYCEGNLI